MKRAILLSAGLLLLSACTGQTNDAGAEASDASQRTEAATPKPDAEQSSDQDAAPAQGEDQTSASDAMIPAGPSAEVKRACGAITPAQLAPEAAKGEKGARNLLLSFAAAIEQRNTACAAALMDGAQNAISKSDLEKMLSPAGTLSVDVAKGQIEGAAGSLYYESDISIAAEKDGAEQTLRQGKVTLRRVNDVPGATPEQLAWHIYSVDMQ